MHFSVLVPVKVPVISDEAKEKAIAANLYIDAASQVSDTEKNRHHHGQRNVQAQFTTCPGRGYSIRSRGR